MSGNSHLLSSGVARLVVGWLVAGHPVHSLLPQMASSHGGIAGLLDGLVDGMGA
jgi:hypothetical protein